jgi:fructokinase
MIKNSNSTWLNNQPLDQDLERALKRPLRFANDANCFVWSEFVDGVARGVNSAFGVIVGTGTGGGLVINGQLVTGANAIAGEWGHNPLPWPTPMELPGPRCYCGKQGCIETFLSGPGLSRSYHDLSDDTCDVQEIVARADGGDSVAADVLNEYDQRMARALASVINIVDPDIIVLGGGLSKLSRLYTNVPELWPTYVFSDHVSTQLLAPRHGDSSGVRGAAWLWP